MSKLRRFEDMEVWKSARSLANNVYRATQNHPFSRDYGLQGQIRRASISIASNIAEGFESQSNATFCRFLAAARGSAAEVRAQLHLALDFGYLNIDEYTTLTSKAESISRQITGLIGYLKKTANNP